MAASPLTRASPAHQSPGMQARIGQPNIVRRNRLRDCASHTSAAAMSCSYRALPSAGSAMVADHDTVECGTPRTDEMIGLEVIYSSSHIRQVIIPGSGALYTPIGIAPIGALFAPLPTRLCRADPAARIESMHTPTSVRSRHNKTVFVKRPHPVDRAGDVFAGGASGGHAVVAHAAVPPLLTHMLLHHRNRHLT